MGGKPKSTSTSISGSAQAWAQPYARGAASDVSNVFAQHQPGLNDLTNTVRGTIVPELVSRFQAGGANASAARGHLGNILSGQYLSGNPHLESIIGAARGGITDRVNSQFSLAGRYGSDAHGSGLARELGNMESNLRYSDYNNQLQRMDSAAVQAQQSSLADVVQALAGAGVGAEIPYAGSANLANSLGALFNGGTSRSVQTGPGGLLGALGAIGGGLASNTALFSSDRRLKQNIEKVGEFADGLGIYEFEYRGEPTRFRGVMADEVKELRPHAYIEDFQGSGYAGVDYAAL